MFHTLARIVFWLTLVFVIIFDIFVSRIKIYGKDNLLLPEKGSFLISNHTLYLDPAIIAHVIAPYRTCFTAMEETFRIIFIGTYIRFLGAFPVSKIMPMHILLSNTGHMLEKRRFIHFFPEGELVHLNTTVNKFKHGVFFLAFRFNKPVIPIIVITKPRPSLGKTLNQYFCKVTVKICKPVYPSQFREKDVTMKTRIKLMADHCRQIMIEEMKSGL